MDENCISFALTTTRTAYHRISQGFWSHFSYSIDH